MTKHGKVPSVKPVSAVIKRFGLDEGKEALRDFAVAGIRTGEMGHDTL